MRRSAVVEHLLLLLAILCVANINGVIYMATGVPQFGSGIMLASAIALIVLCIRSTPPFAWAILVFVATFLCLALIFNAVYEQTTPWLLLLGPAGFVVIFLASASGFTALPGFRKNRLLTRLAWVLAAVAVGTLASPWLVSLYQNAPSDSLRYSGVYMNPNTAAVIGNIGFALCFTLYVDRRKPVFLFLSLICVAAVILTFSKAGLLSMGGIAVLCFSYRLHQRGWYVSGAALVAAIVVWFAYTHWAPTLHIQQLTRFEAVAKLLRVQIDEEITTGRTLVWERATEQILDKGVVLGSGLGTMRNLQGGLYDNGTWMGVHNYWLMLLGEGGIVPFAFFLVLIGLLVWRSMTVTQWRLFVQGYLIAFLVDTMASHNVLEIRYHAIIFGLVVSMVFGTAGYTHMRRERY